MSFVLFVLGLVAAAAGVLMIGFGIPINEFSLGNTLIIAGTTALASGLIVLGLSVVTRQLSRIADILMTRPAGPGSASGRPSDMLEQSPGSGRIAGPRSAHPAEAARGPAAGFELPEEASLPPPRARIPGMGAPPPPSPSPSDAAPRGWRPPGSRPPAPPIAPSEPPRHEPPMAAPQRPEPSFDAAWPDRRPIDPQPDFSAAPDPIPAPRLNGDATHRDVPPPARPASDNAPPTVLKSGVVDGMAYTLYTDGSIEAELAQGVVRFGSIEELRNHLEKGA
jgi:hypothetical protein